jgi:tetratricopeptide (TPR) repeat protein
VQVVVAFSADGTYGRERFFRIPARSRWVGRTHEAFPVEPGAQATIPANLIVWDELPKTAEQLRVKNERDRDLLLREIDDHPDDDRWWYYLGGALAGLGRNEDAINAFREAADRSADESGAMACVRAAVLLTEEKRYEEAVACCARGLTMRADIAELAWIAAGASYNMGALHQAEAFARLAKVHGEAGPGRDALERRVAFRVPKALREGPDEVLALVARAQGKARPAGRSSPAHGHEYGLQGREVGAEVPCERDEPDRGRSARVRLGGRGDVARGATVGAVDRGRARRRAP